MPRRAVIDRRGGNDTYRITEPTIRRWWSHKLVIITSHRETRHIDAILVFTGWPCPSADKRSNRLPNQTREYSQRSRRPHERSRRPPILGRLFRRKRWHRRRHRIFFPWRRYPYVIQRGLSAPEPAWRVTDCFSQSIASATALVDAPAVTMRGRSSRSHCHPGSLRSTLSPLIGVHAFLILSNCFIFLFGCFSISRRRAHPDVCGFSQVLAEVGGRFCIFCKLELRKPEVPLRAHKRGVI